MSANEDTADLEALFDSVAAGVSQAWEQQLPSQNDEPETDDGTLRVFDRVGRLVRQLHDSLQELGYDKLLEGTLNSIPDAKDRLAYISNLTEQAACRVLNATDVVAPLQEAMEGEVSALGRDWERLMSGRMELDEFRRLAHRTRGFFRESAPQCIGQTRAQLTEIMMAQDFQDLTGQVIRKVVSMAQELEKGLLQVLLEVIPESVKREEIDGLINGPVINSEGRSDIVASQTQVDDLLDNLGF